MWHCLTCKALAEQGEEPTSKPAYTSAPSPGGESVCISESQPSAANRQERRELCSYPSVNSLRVNSQDSQDLGPATKPQAPDQAQAKAADLAGYTSSLPSPANSLHSSLTSAGSFSSALGFPLSLPKIEGAFLAAAQAPPPATPTSLHSQQSGSHRDTCCMMTSL